MLFPLFVLVLFSLFSESIGIPFDQGTMDLYYRNGQLQ